ncbi:MAG: hypothetical protein KDE09_22435, partial [Anaerolineales bacterium]|nr:hypothetical protein [Anaerolineales bacterium]
GEPESFLAKRAFLNGEQTLSFLASSPAQPEWTSSVLPAITCHSYLIFNYKRLPIITILR